MQLIAIAATAAFCATQAAAKPTFLPLIPGSGNVKGVEAIGHLNKVGGGDPTSFGVSFYKAKTTWTVDLCYEDSDADGQFNGAELGDPCCEWVKDTNEKLSYDTASHPGDATSKQDPTIWAKVKCADGSDPETKYKAFVAKSGGAAATTAGSSAGNSSSSTDDVKAPAATTATPASANSTTAPAATTAKPASGAAQAAAAASAVTLAVAAFLL